MSFTPRSARQYLEQMAYGVIARSELTDLSPSSVLLQLLWGVAQAMAGVEARLFAMTRAFLLEGQGALLDDRAADFPDPSMRRKGATAASGAVVTLTRGGDLSGKLVVPAGVLLGRADASVLYRTDGEVVFDIHEATVSGVSVVALTPGEAGNAPAGVLTRLVSAPDALIAASNTAPISGGAQTESDERLRARLRLWLSGLAGSQPAALQATALSFVSSQGATVAFAHVFEDLRRPGYSELIIDDGSGGAGGKRAMTPATGTVGAGGALLLWHEAPATAPIEVVRVQRGLTSFELRVSLGHITSCPERGVVWVLDPALLQEGDVWTIATDPNGDPYEVYTGIVAELQRVIEGDASAGRATPGRRAAGTRVRVRPASAQLVAFDLHLLPAQGVDLAALGEQARGAVLRHLQALAPGQTLRASALVADLMALPDLVSVRLYRGGTRAPLEDITPSAPDRSLRSTAGSIKIIPALEEV